MATTSNMFMYSLTLKPSSAVTQAVVGSFSGKSKEQQIVTANGSRLYMQQLSEETNTLVPVLDHDTFGIIRKIAPFRLAGSPKDFLIITSDSGRLTIVEYLPNKNRWVQVHLETFGKSGVRRVIPGEYLATDPKGRACIIASIEKNKLVYVLNRNAQQKLTISSPLEAHKAQTLVYSVIGLDVGYENPVFAVLEVDYSESDQDATGQAYISIEKQLVYYELDLGLNHVVRKWSETVDRTANLLIQVPGGQDGPSGVLVCGEETITYVHDSQTTMRVAVPRRAGKTENPNRKRYIVSGISYKIRQGFFFLVQSEDGDIFKVWFRTSTSDSGLQVEEMFIKYFDTVPLTSSLCILRLGYLFVPSETGDHRLYAFEKLAEDDGEEEFSSEKFPIGEDYDPVYFHLRENTNLSLAQDVESLNPLISSKVTNLTDEDAPQIYTISGTGARSSFKTIRHGLQVNELVDSELPDPPISVWTVKTRADDQYDSYIVLSFSNATLVLKIGENVEEATDTGLETKTQTIGVQQMGDDRVVQIHTRGIKIIAPDTTSSEWQCPTHRTIVAVASNNRQISIALSSGEIVYFEMDDEGGLNEWEERQQMEGTVTCLSMGEALPGRQLSDFLAIGCDDQTVRVLSLREDNRLGSLSVQALTSSPTALNIIAMADSSSGGTTLYLHIGLFSGVYIRTVIDEISGNLSDTRTRFLGPRPVKISQISINGRAAALALSSRSWLAYTEEHTNVFQLAPLHYVPLEWAWNFGSEICPEGIVAVQGKHLRIFNVADLSTNLLIESIPLMYTPRHFARLPDRQIFYVTGSNAQTLSTETREKLKHDTNGDTNGVNGDSEMTELDPADFGYPKGTDHWSSCIQVVDPITEKAVLSTVHLTNNETAVSLAVVTFPSQQHQTFVLVGTAQDLKLSPRSCKAAFVHVYELEDEGRSLKFVHKTKMDEPPMAIVPFQGRVLVGAGTVLRIYDLGLKQLLRKAQIAQAVPNMITGIETQGSRIICSDVQESVTYLVYKHRDNLIVPFADDTVARWTTSSTMVDYETVAGGDKFGNLWIVRAPEKASKEADEDSSGAHLLHEKGYLQGTPHRLEPMAHIFTQDIPTSLQKTSLVAGGRDVLFWSGLQGTLGILVPFVSREDVDFFQQLETEMRKEDAPLAGRDHLMYRGYYVPVKGVIDGDLCERYIKLDRVKKEMIAGELDRSVREVERKIADMRTRVAF